MLNCGRGLKKCRGLTGSSGSVPYLKKISPKMFRAIASPSYRAARTLSPRPGRARTQVIEREASERGEFVTAQQHRRKTMSKKLEGKTAVITGGTEGIGLAAAKLFVKEGAYVFITGRRQKELDEAVKAIGANVYGVQGDVAQLADLDRLYETVSKVKGRIDIVFANAGVGEFVPFGAVTEEHFEKLFNINVRGTLFTVQKALPLLNDGGSIILNGSVASVKGTAAFGVYAASKAAVRSFVRTWTTDLKDRRIRSNVVSPGPINTPLASRQSADVIARIVSTIPMGRMGEPEEVAKASLFLASDDSSFVTGIELFVDGGRAQI
jgi:NAD(P)-dependent dehydrogenase (short-subunit alcohol dehydrogenase family)